MKKNAFIFMLFTLFSTTVLACEATSFDFDRFIAVNDQDHDGFLTEQELLNADMTQDYRNDFFKPESMRAAFKQIDVNKDGKLSKMEMWDWANTTANPCAEIPD